MEESSTLKYFPLIDREADGVDPGPGRGHHH